MSAKGARAQLDDGWGLSTSFAQHQQNLIKAALEDAKWEMENAKCLKEHEIAMVKDYENKLNDPEYVKQQYNMPLSDREFVDWLRGAVDLVGDEPPTKEQWANIKTGVARVIAKRMLDTEPVKYKEQTQLAISNSQYSTSTMYQTLPYNWSIIKGPM